MTTNNFCFYLQNGLIQTSQTGGQWYSDTSPFSIPWVEKFEMCFTSLFLRSKIVFKNPRILLFFEEDFCSTSGSGSGFGSEFPAVLSIVFELSDFSFLTLSSTFLTSVSAQSTSFKRRCYKTFLSVTISRAGTTKPFTSIIYGFS
jgi:hypothetical protein